MSDCNCKTCTLCPMCVDNKVSKLNDIISDLSAKLPRNGETHDMLTAVHVVTLLRCIAARELLKQCKENLSLRDTISKYPDVSSVSLQNYCNLAKECEALKDTYLFRELSARYTEFDSWTIGNLLSGANPSYSSVASAIEFAESCI